MRSFDPQAISWDDLQATTDPLLAEGLCRLLRAPIQRFDRVLDNFPCNYLICVDEIPVYVGEGINAANRIRVQFDERRSTFYKTFMKFEPDSRFSISSFKLRVMETRFGRKEIEDFGIVNLATKLNKFQLGKRQLCRAAESHGEWDEVQSRHCEIIDSGARRCLESEFADWPLAAHESVAGIYLIKARSGDIIYVGESSDISSRYQTHASHTYFSAVRRNLGTDILEFKLQTINGRKRYFEPNEDREVSEFLSKCSIAFIPVNLGRLEIEEKLISELQPVLNRKSKKKISALTINAPPEPD